MKPFVLSVVGVGCVLVAVCIFGGEAGTQEKLKTIRVKGSVRDDAGRPVKNTVYQIAVSGRADDALRSLNDDGTFDQKLQSCAKFDIYFWAGDTEIGVAPGISGKDDVNLPIIYPDFFKKQTLEKKRLALQKFTNSIYVADKTPMTNVEKGLFQKLSSKGTKELIELVYSDSKDKNDRDKLFGTIDYIKKPKSSSGFVTLRAGFWPDPFEKTIEAGGPIKTNVGGVDAWITAQPDFQLYYTAGAYPLSIRAKASPPVVLLMNVPDGQWVSNTDGRFIRFANPKSGRYDIWVGTREKEKGPSSTLQITEVE
jgi:hypothetical protein